MNATILKENKALLIRNDKKLLLKRLNEAKSCLVDIIKRDFKNCKYDFKKACLIGTKNKLQWKLRNYPHDKESYNNQQTNTGIVILANNSK